MARRKITIEGFWAKVDKNGPIPEHCPELGQCWVWTGWKDKDGYGKYGRSSPYGRNVHRQSWCMHFGLIPQDRPNVLHRCDNPPCVRPDHLWVGTNADNSADMVKKGRAASGDRNPMRLYPERVPRGKDHWATRYPERYRRGDAHALRQHPELAVRGEHSPKAKLTENDVREIRRRYVPYKVSSVRLGREFGVEHSAILAIISRKTWAHVKD